MTSGRSDPILMDVLNVLIAPLELKGTLSASDATDAIAEGLDAAGVRANLRCAPLADGGPGTLAAIQRARTATSVHVAEVTASDGRTLEVPWIMSDGFAVIESAKAVGLTLVPGGERQPLSYSSRGVGEMIGAVLDHGARHIAVGVGGTGTVDLGLGCAAALGVRFRGRHGVIDRPSPQELGRIVAIDTDAIDPRLREVRLDAWIDVQAPLLGAAGAVYHYGGQKGVPAYAMPDLENDMARLSQAHGASLPGDGAGGGLGWALRVLLGAELVSGFEAVAAHVGFIEALDWCDLVITAEGRLDAQSLQGKGTWGLGVEAGRRARPVVLFTGSSLLSAEAWRPIFTEVVTMGPSEAHDRDTAYARLVNCVRSYALHGSLETRPWL